MTLNEAKELAKESVKNKNLFKHMLAVGAAMRALSDDFGEDGELWEMAGVLHDIDYDETVNDFSKHGRLAAERLLAMGVEREIVNAVARHPAHDDNPPETRMDWALHIVDPLTGLIVAAALMHPQKKLSALDTAFVMRRFGEKRFAAGANREQIALCKRRLGLSLERFIGIVLQGMQSESDALGL